ncbi:uncharacterized protein LOC110870280 [Helianthus annuus]|uniref:uncharacterized protein LOC110870280 n=1 Tax=Helianthus annuus TaxID=4232 RepID=UPI000B90373C|nr:uncharacterized protein LOC110870280 [Helianthus annuus]
MDLVNQVCKPYMDKFVIVFIHGILVYPETKEGHEQHLRVILKLLKKEQLYAKLSQCEFCIHVVQFLGHVENEKNYMTHDLELGAMIFALEFWRHYSASVVADALSCKERAKPLRMRALEMTIQTNLATWIREAEQEALKPENLRAEALRGLEAQSLPSENGTLYFLELIWVPFFGNLRALISNKTHKSRYSIHPGSDRMYQDFYWQSKMKANIATYVGNCLTYAKVKAEYKKPSELLQQPEIPLWKWEQIPMDIITKLPRT